MDGQCYSKKGAAVNTLQALSKTSMQYKAGRGDPSGFRHHLKVHNIPGMNLGIYNELWVTWRTSSESM